MCNGHAELCDRNYANVTVIGSHDSFAFSTDALDCEYIVWVVARAAENLMFWTSGP